MSRSGKGCAPRQKVPKMVPKRRPKNEGFSTGVMIDGVESTRKTVFKRNVGRRILRRRVHVQSATSSQHFLASHHGLTWGALTLTLRLTHAQSNIDSNEFCIGDSWVNINRKINSPAPLPNLPPWILPMAHISTV